MVTCAAAVSPAITAPFIADTLVLCSRLFRGDLHSDGPGNARLRGFLLVRGGTVSPARLPGAGIVRLLIVDSSMLRKLSGSGRNTKFARLKGLLFASAEPELHYCERISAAEGGKHGGH